MSALSLLYVAVALFFTIITCEEGTTININFAGMNAGGCGGSCAHPPSMSHDNKMGDECNPDIAEVVPPLRMTVQYSSRWGHGDTLGAVNYLSPQITLKASSLIKTGESFALGVITAHQTPAFGTRYFNLSVVSLFPEGLGDTVTTAHDDYLEGHIGVGSQVDGLGHIGLDNVYYNKREFPAVQASNEEHGLLGGVDVLGTHSLPPITTRAVVIDVAAYKNMDILPDDYLITVSDLKGALRRQNKCIRRGDVVIIHTGYAVYGDHNSPKFDAARFMAMEPGIGVNAAEWLAKNEVVAVGSDTWGIECINGKTPTEEGRGVFEGHQILILHHGVYLLENMNVKPMLDRGYDECMFVLGVPRYEGSVQAIINPVCLV